jgi:glycosyltransferase involved in cell wall biosynthesis
MATGMPVVATEVGGIPELVEHGRNGLLVPPGRSDDLARAVVELLGRPSFARALGRQARLDVQARYSFDRMVRQFEQLFLAEAAARASSPGWRSQPVTS